MGDAAERPPADAMTLGIAIVFGLVLAAGVLFATEWVPPEITALGIAVALALLEPWTLVTPAEAISGFASPATVAVLAMFILSEGVRRTGVVGRLGRRLARLTLGSERRQLAVTLGLGGPLAGVVNNTPLVGVLIPLVVDLARRSRTSPSRLLLPLSYFRNRYYGTVLAVRRGDRVLPERIETRELREGDSLLVLMRLAQRSVLEAMPGVVVTRVTPMEEGLREPSAEEEAAQRRTPLALGIVAAVVVVAALGVVPIAITALGGVVLMVATRCLRTSQAYEAVSWDVIFLLAGLIPLGVAMERTGAARLLADLVLEPIIGSAPASTTAAIMALAAFYLGTALLTNLVSNNASVVLMIPVAIDAAQRIGADPFPFVVAVTFAASTAFLTPVGYQTNLMVYGPGGYRFSDYARVGGPLQVLLAVVTPLVIVLVWGL